MSRTLETKITYGDVELTVRKEFFGGAHPMWVARNETGKGCPYIIPGKDLETLQTRVVENVHGHEAIVAYQKEHGGWDESYQERCDAEAHADIQANIPKQRHV